MQQVPGCGGYWEDSELVLLPEAVPSCLQGAGHAVPKLGSPRQDSNGNAEGAFFSQGSSAASTGAGRWHGAQGYSDIMCFEGPPLSCKCCIHCRHSLTQDDCNWKKMMNGKKSPLCFAARWIRRIILCSQFHFLWYRSVLPVHWRLE